MPKRVIFVDRDGTIIVEPPVDYQVDSLEKLSFVPGAISALARLSKLGYELVLATNQDGLGTESFPYADFEPPHRKMLETLEGEGVKFDDQLIDRTFEEDNAPTRKPRTGMFGKYLSGDYDLAGSFVIGDRDTDMELAKNLGCQGLKLGDKTWSEIAEYIRRGARRAELHRQTRETDIKISLDLDGLGGESRISTGLRFLDHMLDQLPHHAGITSNVEAKGDLDVDEHHTMEDTAIVLGEAIAQALGNKAGIGRYGFALPMDDSRALVLLDFGGRIDLEWDVDFKREMVGDVPTEMFRHFFQSLCCGAKCNMYVSAKGDNDHHKAEAIFKAFARALRQAIARSEQSPDMPSSKGVL